MCVVHDETTMPTEDRCAEPGEVVVLKCFVVVALCVGVVAAAVPNRSPAVAPVDWRPTGF